MVEVWFRGIGSSAGMSLAPSSPSDLSLQNASFGQAIKRIHEIGEWRKSSISGALVILEVLSVFA